ncbi:MAG: IPExxxVDY family protein [Sphingobacteriia bacterium]|nr:IPExxxVDY family protein [Sphingobacteriia bacterium]
MKLRLDVDELNDDFFEDTRLLGITATMKNYQFCMQLNNMLGYDFRLNPEIEIHLKKKNRSYYFSIYQYKEPNNSLVHYLYQNQFDGEYLLPEFKHMDFLWLMKYEYVDDEKCNWMRQTIRNLNGVQMIVELTNEQIKNKGNMVF